MTEIDYLIIYTYDQKTIQQ